MSRDGASPGAPNVHDEPDPSGANADELLRSLARERERLAVALRTGRFGVYEWRIGESVVWWSPEIYPIYGVDPATFTPTPEAFGALVHPDDRDELWRKTEACIAAREVFVHEYRIVRPDGTVRWLANRSHIGLDAAGEVERIIGVASDITERKLAENALRDAEERLRLATHAGNIGIWEWDVRSDEVVWSDRVYALHDLGPGQFGGRSADFSVLIHPDDRDAVWSRIQAALRDGESFTSEFRTVLPNGGQRWLSTWAWIHRDADGAPIRMIGATINIDAYKRVEAALRDGDRRKDEFLAVLSHELRNPLAPMRNALRLLGRDTLSPTGQRALSMLDRQVVHLVRLVDDLLDMSRITRGQLTLKLERMPLQQALRDAAETLASVVHERRQSLRLELDDAPTWIDADPVRIAQVIENLLTNACRYTDPGGEIVVRLSRDADRALIQIRDTGIGLCADQLTRVFEPFTQVRRNDDRSGGGLGIGLAIVRQLVEMHGGSARATSPGLGQGSTFEVRLPLSPGPVH